MFQRPRTPLAGFVPASAADARWKGALVALCAVGFFFTALQFASDIALGSHEWFGWWDETAARVNPFTLAAIDVIPNGAAARAGIRVGDRFDLRRQSLDGRVDSSGNRLPIGRWRTSSSAMARASRRSSRLVRCGIKMHG